MAARERDESSRAAWWSETLTLPVADLVFLDETGTNTAMSQRYARAPRGERANGRAPRNHGPNTTLLACLTRTGMGPAMLVEGATTTEVFTAYVDQVLAPWLRPGQIVILDNLSAHTGERVRQRIEAAGCQLRFLPAYSPDFSPIEWAFSKLKTAVRAAMARTRDALERAIASGLDQITAADADGWFHGCGYVVRRQPL
ncbi:MAG: IS630 family transposase [Thermomicrobiales bacterium]